MPQEQSKPREVRRGHRKSRNGCLICKKRHVKCDERRPSCEKCAIGGRPCLYANRPRNTGPELLTGISLATVAAQATHAALPICTPGHFTTSDMSLLYHLATHAHFVMPAKDYVHQVIIRKALESAHEAPYLIDQVLALSALHLSATNGEAPAALRQQATALQNRALGHFRASRGTTDSNYEVNFLFAATLGMQVFKTTLTDHMDTLANFVSAFIGYVHIFNGVGAVIDDKWPALLDSDLGPHLRLAKEVGNREGEEGSDHGTRELRQHLESTSEATTPATSSCIDALRSVQRLLNFSAAPGFGLEAGVTAATAWPRLVSAEYIEGLHQHRPQALVVLAYYGVLLHQSRDFWIFEGSGATLVRMVAAHMGPFWAEYLAWPLRMVSDTGARKTARCDGVLTPRSPTEVLKNVSFKVVEPIVM